MLPTDDRGFFSKGLLDYTGACHPVLQRRFDIDIAALRPGRLTISHPSPFHARERA